MRYLLRKSFVATGVICLMAVTPSFSQQPGPPDSDRQDQNGPAVEAQASPDTQNSGPQDRAQNGGWRRFGDSPADRPQIRQRQAEPAPPQAYSPSQLTIPAGAWITVRVNEPLSSDHNHSGDAFTATLTQPVVANGFVIARRGQTIGGRVAEVDKGGRVKGTSRLGLELTELSLVDGQQIPLRTELIVNSSGSSIGRDAAAIGTTTGVGAAIGAAADGGFGAGMGAIAGAGASIIGVLVTRGHPTVVYPESALTFRVLAPVVISTERSTMAFEPVRQADFSQSTMCRRPAPVASFGPAPYYYGSPWGYNPYYYGYGPSFFFYSSPRFYHRGFRRY